MKAISKKMKTKVQIENKTKKRLNVKRKISKIVELLFQNKEIVKNSAIKGFNIDRLLFDIVFTDDIEIRKINKKYRNKDKETDVITFALFADDDNKFVFNKEVHLGEIIISVETAENQAQNGFDVEILTLICHGILHLLGFDHLNDEDYNFVVRTQKEIISKLYEKISI